MPGEPSVSTVYTPLAPPAQGISNIPEPIAEQQEKWQTVYQYFTKEGYTLPGVENGALIEEEKFWLSYECLYRYLRASKWNPDHCIERLESTLKWRREYGIYDKVTAQHVEPEAVTGKGFMFGYDVTGRPGLYLVPSRQNTTDPVRQIQFTVWILEKAIDLMAPGVETLALLINFADKAKNPSLNTSLEFAHILQTHYPERLGLAIVIKIPFLVHALLKMIMPFLDPVTRNKMKLNAQVVDDGLFTPEMLVAEGFGGRICVDYIHEKYWPAFVGLCERRSSFFRTKWREMGGTIGLKEADYKQGAEAVGLIQDHTRESADTDTPGGNRHVSSEAGTSS